MRHFPPYQPVAEVFHKPMYPTYDRSDRGYADLVRIVNVAITTAVRYAKAGILWETDSTAQPFDTYLNALPASERRYYTCNCCRKVFNECLGLVYFDTAGRRRSVLHHLDLQAVRALNGGVHSQGLCLIRDTAELRTVTPIQPYIPENHMIGVPTSGGFMHMHVQLPESYRAEPSAATRTPLVASIQQNIGLARALAADAPSLEMLAKARAALIDTESQRPIVNLLPQFDELYGLVSDVRVNDRAAYWNAVERPAACHARSSVVWTYLEDYASKGSDAAIRALNANVSPLVYRRPQALPSQQAAAQADRELERLGYSRLLPRRVATMADVGNDLPLVWQQHSGVSRTAPEETYSASFGSVPLRGRSATPVTLDRGSITYARFKREVLPNAVRMSTLPTRDWYTAVTTSVASADKTLFIWDSNFCQYTYSSPMDPSTWGLLPQETPIVAVVESPALAHGRRPLPQVPPWALFVIQGCRDRDPGCALFPQLLVPELQPFRRTIEAYSNANSARQALPYAQAVAGLRVSDARSLTVKVTTRDGGVYAYTVSSWD